MELILPAESFPVQVMAEDTGGTIIMDHGHGISTMYSHLETVMVS